MKNLLQLRPIIEGGRDPKVAIVAMIGAHIPFIALVQHLDRLGGGGLDAKGMLFAQYQVSSGCVLKPQNDTPCMCWDVSMALWNIIRDIANVYVKVCVVVNFCDAYLTSYGKCAYLLCDVGFRDFYSCISRT